MKLLLDISETRRGELPGVVDEVLAGQLLTPLTRYKRWSDVFAIDNGAYTQFDHQAFRSLLEREREARDKCLFVTVPDIVGSARRTLEIWQKRYGLVPEGWRLAYVVQDGAEDLEIPWSECQAIFIGGTTRWKDSHAAADIVKTAHILRKHVHVGRVNTRRRWNHFEELGADTCDGSGVARFDHMGEKMLFTDDKTLFDKEEPGALHTSESGRVAADRSRHQGTGLEDPRR